MKQPLSKTLADFVANIMIYTFWWLSAVNLKTLTNSWILAGLITSGLIIFFSFINLIIMCKVNQKNLTQMNEQEIHELAEAISDKYRYTEVTVWAFIACLTNYLI